MLASEPSAGCTGDPMLAEAQEQERHAALARAGLLVDLREQVARLSDGWGGRLTVGSDSATLAMDLARSLVEAGFQIHDCAARAHTGGVCLIPRRREGGIIVTWTTHESLHLDRQRYGEDQAAREVMNFALYETLLALGWDVREYGQAGANLILGRQAVEPQEVPGE